MCLILSKTPLNLRFDSTCPYVLISTSKSNVLCILHRENGSECSSSVSFHKILSQWCHLKKRNECFCSGLSLSLQLDCIHDRIKIHDIIKITSELMILQIFFLWRSLPVWLLHLRTFFQHWIKAKSKHMETVIAVFTPGQIQLLQAPFTYIYFHPLFPLQHITVCATLHTFCVPFLCAIHWRKRLHIMHLQKCLCTSTIFSSSKLPST